MTKLGNPRVDNIIARTVSHLAAILIDQGCKLCYNMGRMGTNGNWKASERKLKLIPCQSG